MSTMIPVRTELFIQKKIESKMYPQAFRPHLGASVLGKKCKREIWYSFRWCKQDTMTARMQRLVNRGHMEEIVLIEDLINSGVKVEGINIDDSIRQRFLTVFKHTLPTFKQKNNNFAFGHGGGSCDGTLFELPDAFKTPHLLESKTANQNNFVKIKRNKIIKSKPEHYIQVQVYMYLFKLKRCLYVVVHKDTDERHYERINYDKKFALKYIKIAETIISSEKPFPKTSTNPEVYGCRYCLYNRICHSSEMVDRNCRTCNKSGLRDNGKWICERNNKQIKYKRQVKGCSKYKLLKTL